MKKYSFWIIFGVIAVLLVGFSIWQRQTAVQVSEDELSQGISQRWDGGLPDGFEKTEATDTDGAGSGYLFAKLVYQKDIANLLEQWESASAGTGEAFLALTDAYLQCDFISEANRAVVQNNRPAVSDAFIGFSMEKEDSDAQIVLLYDKAGQTMYIAERLAP